MRKLARSLVCVTVLLGFGPPQSDSGPPEGGRYMAGMWRPAQSDSGPPEGGRYMAGMWHPAQSDSGPPEGGRYMAGMWRPAQSDSGPPEGGRYMAGMWRPALAGLSAQTLSAQTPADDAKALAARAAARIRELERDADRLAAEARTVFGDLRKLEIERAIKREELATIEAELVALTAAGAAAAAHVKSLEATRVAQIPGVASRLVEIAKRGRGGYLPLLLASDDVRAFGRLSRGVAAVAELDRVRLETHRRTIAAERGAVTELNRRGVALADSQQRAAAARAALDAAVAARNRLIDDLDRRRDLTAAYVAELQDAQRAVARAIATAGASSTTLALPIRPFRGDLTWPVPGKVVAGFGRPPAGRFGTTIVRNGIEIAAPEGEPARAVHEGIVAYAARFTGFGVLVIVDHGASAFTLYGHLTEALVAQGSRVKRGEVVGRVGLIPAGDAGLYFELRIDGRPVDPLQWLRRSR